MRTTTVVSGFLLVGLIVVALLWRTKFETVDGRSADNPYNALRQQALTKESSAIGLTVNDDAIWGVIMDLPADKGVATVVAFADGSASIYLSTGGGYIGGGEKPSVGGAAKGFVSAATQAKTLFVPTTQYSLPGPDEVRFFARTRGGVLVAEAREKDLQSGRHALSPLYIAGHGVVTAYMRGTDSTK